jgi:hypothetical protein
METAMTNDLNSSGIKAVRFMTATVRVGDHMQPSGTCDRCGAGIMNVFVVIYRDGLVQHYGSECINKILNNAPSMKSLFHKNSKLLKKYQGYLDILSLPVEQMPRGSEYYGSGLYFIGDPDGKDILYKNFLFHPLFDEEKNAGGPNYIVRDKAAHVGNCEKHIGIMKTRLTAEVARLEAFLGRVMFKAMQEAPRA